MKEEWKPGEETRSIFKSRSKIEFTETTGVTSRFRSRLRLRLRLVTGIDNYHASSKTKD